MERKRQKRSTGYPSGFLDRSCRNSNEIDCLASDPNDPLLLVAYEEDVALARKVDKALKRLLKGVHDQHLLR